MSLDGNKFFPVNFISKDFVDLREKRRQVGVRNSQRALKLAKIAPTHLAAALENNVTENEDGVDESSLLVQDDMEGPSTPMQQNVEFPQ